MGFFSLIAWAALAQADDQVFSGKQAGEKLPPFKVQSVLGPQAGKEVEVIGEIKGKPCVIVFVHEFTRPALQLMKPIDAFGDKWAKDGLATHFVALSADRSKTEQYLQNAQKSLGIKSPFSVSVDGLEGPGPYGLNRKCTLSIMVANDNKVVANFALIQPNETDAPKVIAAVAKVLGKTVPTAEEVYAQGGGRRPDAPATGPDPELGRLMRSLIQPNNDEAKVKEIVDAMVKWAGDDAKKKTQLSEYCKTIIKAGYGNDIAKRALKRLAGE
jgi:hypothetical protein